jgi:hypothetical protein
MNTEILDWLLSGDPSIIFLTKKDLLETGASDIVVAQDRISKEGWGQRLLSFQDRNGMWGGGLYGPKWISTHYTLMTLMQLGLSQDNEQALQGCKLLLDKGFYHDGGINYFVSLKHSETCVTAMTLNLLCYFNIHDERIELLKNFLLEQQMRDGGWNCESFNGAIHSSFHTTISTLEALWQYERRYKKNDDAIKTARTKGHDFLLCHHLFKSDKTGEVVSQAMTRLSFPPRWKYDIMRSLDYFREVNVPHDPRFCDAITLLKKKQKNGKWPLQQHHSGREFFKMEQAGQPSRMNTFRALRILKWWQTKPEHRC